MDAEDKSCPGSGRRLISTSDHLESLWIRAEKWRPLEAAANMFAEIYRAIFDTRIDILS